jgi:ribosomal protein L17
LTTSRRATETRNGGYTRLVRVGRRRGDAVETALLELVE